MRRLWILALLAAVVAMHGVSNPSIDPAGPSAVASVQHGTDHDVDAPSERSGRGHDTASHALSLCVAVLLGGLALLAAASAVRTSTPSAVRDRTRHGSRLRLGLPLPRPPDLSALCLLRI